MSRRKQAQYTTLSKWIPHEYPKTVLTTLPHPFKVWWKPEVCWVSNYFQCTDHRWEAKGRWSLVRAPAYKFNYSFVLTVLRSNNLETFLFLVYYLGLVFLFAKQNEFQRISVKYKLRIFLEHWFYIERLPWLPLLSFVGNCLIFISECYNCLTDGCRFG